MIEIDKENQTYICPYCQSKQAYGNSFFTDDIGYPDRMDKHGCAIRSQGRLVYSIKCSNQACQKISIVAFDEDGMQHDILPEFTCREYPDYIPKAIRDDYTEAVSIIDKSPKAAATLFRRCLQGMINDFWHIKKNKLADSIEALNDKIPPMQWETIDNMRKIGNVGAHMEKDINLIIDIEPEEALILKTMIELLLDNWYIARHNEQETYKSINTIAEKIKKVKGNKE